MTVLYCTHKYIHLPTTGAICMGIIPQNYENIIIHMIIVSIFDFRGNIVRIHYGSASQNKQNSCHI